MRGWFSDNHVDKFTIKLRFRVDGDITGHYTLLNNGDCVSPPSFQLALEGGAAFAAVSTDDSGLVVTSGEPVCACKRKMAANYFPQTQHNDFHLYLVCGFVAGRFTMCDNHRHIYCHL